MGEKLTKNDQEATVNDETVAQEDVSVAEAVVGSATPKERKASVITVIAVAVLIATGLITLGFMTYNAPDAPPVEPATTSMQAGDELDTTSPVNESVIDNEADQIDRIIDEMDNDSDFDESGLRDDNLGI